MIIVPAILENNFPAVLRKIDRVAGLVETVQVDICDGLFVPSKTYASSGRSNSIKNIVLYIHRKKMKVELDLMIDLDQPRTMTRWCETLCVTNIDRVIFHLGSTYRWDELFARIKQCSKKTNVAFECGLAVRVDHSRNEIRKTLEAHEEFSFIQIMGIKRIGHSGETLTPEIYSCIRKISRAFPDMPIQIDGGVKIKHTHELFAAGAHRLGMNSGLFQYRDLPRVLTDITGQ